MLKTSIPCPICGKVTQFITESPRFNRTLWEANNTLYILDFCLSHFKRAVTPRQIRLLACGVARIHFAQFRSELLWEAVTLGERWADEGHPHFGVDDIRRKFAWHSGADHRPSLQDWTWLAASCLSLAPQLHDPARGETLAQAFAEVFRELIPNPFVPLAWKPVWLTATVRDVAQHIYTAQEFSAMPILADALQDAGCDSDYILSHCRANKPHARGCWVLDAILGKS